MVANAFAAGSVVAFLGAGANRSGRPDGAGWEKGRYLPDGTELTMDLAGKFAYPRGDGDALARVAQYVSLMAGPAPLYQRLREIFGCEYPPTPMHELLAEIPAILAQRRRLERCPLIVTTNYDDLVERAFGSAPLDVVVFAPREGRTGLFDLYSNRATAVNGGSSGDYYALTGPPTPLESPEDLVFDLEVRPVLLKIHGVVADDADCVITEDDYIEYLALGDVLAQLPKQLAGVLRSSNFLFLGYGMADWNIRALLRRIQREQRRGWSSWAVQRRPDPFDERLWTTREVHIFDVPIDEYVGGLRTALEALPAA